MIRAKLALALDCPARKDVPRSVVTFQINGNWYIVREGPNYCQVLQVLECDEEGLALLRLREKPADAVSAATEIEANLEVRPMQPVQTIPVDKAKGVHAVWVDVLEPDGTTTHRLLLATAHPIVGIRLYTGPIDPHN